MADGTVTVRTVVCSICGVPATVQPGVWSGYIVHTGTLCGNRVEEVQLRPSWSHIWMNLARELSHRSTCRRNAVGSVVVSDDNARVLAIGYNGNYRGGPNDCDTDEVGNCGCIHGEANAVVKLGYETLTATRTMYCTVEPCVNCAKLIVNVAIQRVVYDREYRNHDGLAVLTSAGVTVERYQEAIFRS